MANSIEWQRRLLLSLVLSVIVVVVSSVAFLALSWQPPADAHQQTSKTAEIREFVFGIPLAPGWLAVSLVFGEWRAVHQGQIALIPFISVAIDTGLIFGTWQFFRRVNGITDKSLSS